MVTGTPRVRLVVLDYQGGDDVVRCVEALSQLDWPADRREIVVVDNASTDGSAARIERRFPGVRIVRNDRNTGFPANNLALADLDGVDYVGLVNQDSFVEPGWLRPLVAALDADDRLGAVSARLLLAERYVDVVLDAPTTAAGWPDRRALGVQVSGARVGGRDVWSDVHAAGGSWGIEHDRRLGPLWWTTDHAVVRLPVAGDEAASGRGGAPVTGELRLAAPSCRTVTLRCGGAEVRAEVGPDTAWVAVPLAASPRDIVNNAGSVVSTDGFGADRGYGEPADGRYERPADLFAWSGGSVLLRPSYLADVGLFDERFFLYYEDTDLSWRGRRRGWRYRYVPGAVARHRHATSTGVASAAFQYYTERNRLLMLLKNAPARMVAAAVGRYLLVTLSYARRDLVAPLLGGRRPRPEQVRRRLRSFAGVVRLAPAMVAARRVERRAATVSDGEVSAGLTPR